MVEFLTPAEADARELRTAGTWRERGRKVRADAQPVAQIDTSRFPNYDRLDRFRYDQTEPLTEREARWWEAPDDSPKPKISRRSPKGKLRPNRRGGVTQWRLNDHVALRATSEVMPIPDRDDCRCVLRAEWVILVTYQDRTYKYVLLDTEEVEEKRWRSLARWEPTEIKEVRKYYDSPQPRREMHPVDSQCRTVLDYYRRVTLGWPC